MKSTKFFILLLALFSCSNYSCKENGKEKVEYPIVSGEQTFVGKLTIKGAPATTSPPLPCAIFWLETTSGDYALTVNSHQICNEKLTVDDVEYSMDDEVEIIGTVTVQQDIYSKEYFTLDIKTIRTLISN